MKDKIEDFQKTKDFLVCVDSDGCAMDTMDVKHEEAFGPEAVNVWNLHHIKDHFLEVWNDINLYTKTRGINRFKGVVQTFAALEAEGIEMPDISSFKKWTETTNELSNPSLERAIAETNDEQLKKALEWSHAVNHAIEEKLAGNDKPVEGAKEGLEAANHVANVAIVSSANGAAVLDEWTRHELAVHVDVMLGQEAGTKAYCIQEMKKFDFDNTHVLMVGDAPGDLDAAVKNGVFYYPILVGKEKFSWERFKNEALGKFLDGSYKGEYQQQLIDEFNSNLK
ncbi:HAD family hydrolase [Bacillus sp. V3B]|uniref:HAD family hydrolase n=1 Tax=Bacillus sp. V3B TaxID=2804915 RepID=UPI00210B7B68|nr:HAD hydrolase-like protein [Bacillus sp. V3B]MCQ6275653.1 HAD family hydrolase [Bacillus sp. V3B]